MHCGASVRCAPSYGCGGVGVEYRARNERSGLDRKVYLTYVLNMDTLSQTFSALADPTRRAILARLATGAATVGELAEPFEMSLPAVSRHLRVLTEAGLIERHTEAQWRRCELRGEGFKAAADWIEFYRRFWEQSFDRLDAFLKRTAPDANKPAPDKPKKGKRHGRVR
jgi:DNA-binding transcriptional ArsR family regulator